MKNKDIKQKAKLAGVKLWRIADALGLQDTSFSRKLRYELADTEKAEIFDIIDNIKERE